jgi:hypothetical protein
VAQDLFEAAGVAQASSGVANRVAGDDVARPIVIFDNLVGTKLHQRSGASVHDRPARVGSVMRYQVNDTRHEP